MAYWTFDRDYLNLKAMADPRAAGQDLDARIQNYLHCGTVPAHVRRAIGRIRFKTALLTDDEASVRLAAQELIRAFYEDPSSRGYESLLQLGSMTGEIQKRYPKQAEEWLPSLVEQMVQHAGPDIGQDLNRLMVDIHRNKWFAYGRSLLDEVCTQGFISRNIADTLGTTIEASRLARDRRQPDLSDVSASVEKYIARLDAYPPRGEIDINDLHHIVETGLSMQFGTSHVQSKHKAVEDVITSVRLIAGEGPFCGDPNRLVQSIARFAKLYLTIDQADEPIDTVLATFLALSFCDTSTEQDHNMLSHQFHGLCSKFEAQINQMLGEHELSSLVTTQDIEGIFHLYEQVFRLYVDDPLWPAFKYPLTANECQRLASRVSQRIVRIEPILDEMSLKVQYGGKSPTLKSRTVYEISCAVQELLPATAFLRKPPYPGVSCQYRGRYGFTVVIKGPLYREGDRPREKFKAMKYFHLGHRLEDIVERERELARISKTQESNQ